MLAGRSRGWLIPCCCDTVSTKEAEETKNYFDISSIGASRARVPACVRVGSLRLGSIGGAAFWPLLGALCVTVRHRVAALSG